MALPYFYDVFWSLFFILLILLFLKYYDIYSVS